MTAARFVVRSWEVNDGPGSRVRRALPWIWTGIVFVASVALFLTGDFETSGFASATAAAAWLLLPILFTVSGALILSRQPENRIGWILMLVAVGVLLDSAAQPFLTEVAPSSPTALDYVMIFLANTMWMVIFFPLFLLLYLFPDGRYLNRRWSWAGWLAVTLVSVLLVLGALGPKLADPNDRWVIDNPIAVFSTDVFDQWFVSVPWGLGLIALPLGGLAAMVVRFRRSSPVVRTQIKWVLYAGAVLALVYAFSVVATSIGGSSFGDLAIGVLFVLSIALIPISITAAIVRYKLFEIDRIISRTLSYTVVVALLAALYFGAVTAVTELLPIQNAVAVAASTLLVATMFNPLRKRVQRVVDYRFNRSAYQAEMVSEEFAARLRESLTIEELTQLWNQTVTEFLQPATSGLWLSQQHSSPERHT